MNRFPMRLAEQLRAADRRLERRMADRVRARASRNADDGFMLLETIIAIGLISVVMAAFTTFFVNATASTSQQRGAQIATQVANSTVEIIRGLPASDLVSGHDTSSVAIQFTAASSVVQPWLASMTQATDPSTPAAGTGRTATIPTIATTQTVNSVAYSINTYLGTCVIPTGTTSNASCGLGAASSGITYLRAVVAVTWTNSRCLSSTCTYVTSTLVNPGSDPTFNLSQVPPALPAVTNPGAQTSAVGDSVSLQLSVTGVAPITWYLPPTALPAGLAMNTTGLIAGTPTTVTSATSVTVTVTDAFGRNSNTTFTWSVVPRLVIGQPANQANVTGSATSGLTLTATGGVAPYTWSDPNGTLPPGLSIATVGNQGKVTGTPTTAGTFPVVLMVTDSTGTRTATSAFSWTITYPPFAATNPGTQTSTITRPESVQLTVTGGSGSFAWTGGSSLPAGLTLTSGGLISGTPTALGTTAVSLTATDSITHVSQNVAFTWKVLAKPTVTSPGNQTVTAGSSIALALSTTCPNAPCSYVFNNPPGTFSIDSSGNLTGTVTNSPGTYSGATVTVTDNDGATGVSSTFVVTVNGPPGAPNSFAVTAGDGQVTASWTAPTNTYGAAVTGYTVTSSPGPATCTTAAATTCTVTGLTNGTRYTFAVTATNSYGTGPASSSVTASARPALLVGTGRVLWLDGADSSTVFQDSAGTTPTTAAGQPVALWKDKSGAGNNVSTTSTAPTQNTSAFGGLGATTFASGAYLSRSSGFPTSSNYTEIALYRPTSTSCTGNIVSGTASTASHAFFTNGATGIGPWHNGAFATATGQGVAANTAYVSSATYTTGTRAGSTDVNGASPVTGTAGAETTDPGIQIGAYAGASGFCGQIGEVIVLSRVVTATERRAVEDYLARKWSVTLAPQASTNLASTINTAGTTATLTWTAPTWNGGANVTGYTVTATPGGATCTTTTATSCTITGLTNATQLTFTVTATNSVGTGPASVMAYPALITGTGARLWLDGADQTTLFQDNAATIPTTVAGDPVALWKDKSGAANNVSTTGTAPTLDSSSFTGLTAPTFTTGSYLTRSAGFPTSSDYTVFTAYRPTSVTTGATSSCAGTILAGDGGSPGHALDLQTDSGTGLALQHAANFAQNTGVGKTANTAYIGSATFVTSTRVGTTDVNGTSPVSSTASGQTTDTGLQVGANAGAASFCGQIAEVIMLNRVVTTAERRTVAEYLARKWGGTITPPAPTAVTAGVAGTTSATVSWTPPTWNGGAAITGYTVSSSPGAKTCTTTGATSCTVTGLTHNTTYTFTVTASNSVGVGQTSAASNSTTP